VRPGVRSVLVERPGIRSVSLVMRRSGVRLPKAARFRRWSRPTAWCNSLRGTLCSSDHVGMTANSAALLAAHQPARREIADAVGCGSSPEPSRWPCCTGWQPTSPRRRRIGWPQHLSGHGCPGAGCAAPLRGWLGRWG